MINGIGGIGKTEIARYFFHKNFDNYVHVAWIDYHTDFRKSLLSNYTLTESLGIQYSENDSIDIKFEKLLSKIINLDKNSLFVIDNLNNDYDPYLNKILGNNFDILITSRHKF